MPTTKDALIAKYVSGNCSPEEEALLLAWARKDKLHAQELELAKKDWDEAGRLKKNDIYNADAAWQDFVQLKDKPYTSLVPSPRKFLLRIAAILVVLLAIGFVIRFTLFKISGPVAELASISKPAATELSDIRVISVYSADSAVSFVLPDSSHVSLNRYSSLHYTKFYNMDRRAVYLNGEAFFDVMKNDSIPFYVICGDISIRVTGTSFDVKAGNKNKLEITVVSGTVEVENNKHPEQKIVLQQQEKGVFDTTTSSYAKAKSSNKDLKWKEKRSLKKRIQNFIQKFRKKA